MWRFGSPSGLASSRRRQTDTLNLCKVHLLFSPFLSYIKGFLVNTSDSVSLFYYIVICKTDWNWKKCAPGPPQKCGPGPPTVLVRPWWRCATMPKNNGFTLFVTCIHRIHKKCRRLNVLLYSFKLVFRASILCI